jgi:ornithine carbamoyltransferase
MLTASRVGLNMHIATPKGYEPNNNIVKKAQDEAKLHKSEVVLGNDPVEAVKDADFIYTDVWTSMHQKDEFDKRKEIFSAYQINKQLLAKAKKDYYIMHCLPAQRGFEITDEVMDAPQSICYEQAENRLHVQKAILLLLLKNK